jgi:hypothetical protein
MFKDLFLVMDLALMLAFWVLRMHGMALGRVGNQ